MAMSVNLEIVPKLKSALPTISEEMIPNVKKTIDEIDDAAAYTGVPFLIKSAESNREGAELVLKATEELVEVIEEFLSKYGKLAEATGY